MESDGLMSRVRLRGRWMDPLGALSSPNGSGSALQRGGPRAGPAVARPQMGCAPFANCRRELWDGKRKNWAGLHAFHCGVRHQLEDHCSRLRYTTDYRIPTSPTLVRTLHDYHPMRQFIMVETGEQRDWTQLAFSSVENSFQCFKASLGIHGTNPPTFPGTCRYPKRKSMREKKVLQRYVSMENPTEHFER
jgi:hypothetical protein